VSLDDIQEINLSTNDSLREFANTKELERAYEHVKSTGWNPNDK
jgi:hypothetical protein